MTSKMVGLLYRLCGKRRPKTAAVILAGGMGTRMQSNVTKQLLYLCGKPVLLHTVLAFDGCDYIDELVVVSREEERKQVYALLHEAHLLKPFRVVRGGDTRQESARRGLEAISAEMKFIAVHDAARCLVTSDMIADVVSAAYASRAASAGCACTDTVKRVDKNGYVCETVDRDSLMMAQTPQVFEVGLYRAATYVAKERGVAVTDDNMLLESIGQAVRMVDCGKENVKITTPSDLIFAEAVLKERKRNVTSHEKKKGGKR